MVRGWQVRSWFRHNIAQVRLHRSSREQFARLASIGRSASIRRTRSTQSDISTDTDLLAQQVRVSSAAKARMSIALRSRSVFGQQSLSRSASLWVCPHMTVWVPASAAAKLAAALLPTQTAIWHFAAIDLCDAVARRRRRRGHGGSHAVTQTRRRCPRGRAPEAPGPPLQQNWQEQDALWGCHAASAAPGQNGCARIWWLVQLRTGALCTSFDVHTLAARPWRI